MTDHRLWIGGIVAVAIGIAAYASGTVEAQQKKWDAWGDICRLVCPSAPVTPIPPQPPVQPSTHVDPPTAPIQPRPEQTHPVPPVEPTRYIPPLVLPAPPVTPLPPVDVSKPKPHKPPKPHPKPKAVASDPNEVLPPCWMVCAYAAGKTREQLAAEGRTRNPSASMRRHALSCLAGCNR